MKIAVVGANGFIGTRLVEMFHLTNYAEVIPVVRSFSSLARLSKFDLNCRLADAQNEAALAHAFAGCDAIVHAALGDGQTIVGMIEPLYRAAQKVGVRRIVYLSSGSVHGQAPAPGTNEETPLSDRQGNWYNDAKVRAERKLAALRQGGNVETVVLRPGIVFGPRSRWVSELAEQLMAGSACLVNRGEGVCNSIYVDNLIHAIRLALETPTADGQAFLIGDAETISWREFYTPFAEAFGGVEILPVSPFPPEHGKRRNLLDHVRGLPGSQRVLPLFSPKWKQAVKGAWAAWTSTLPSSGWDIETVPKATPSGEMYALQSCQWKLPHTKAKRVLGYTPPVPFAEGCERSIAWLSFAGYLPCVKG